MSEYLPTGVIATNFENGASTSPPKQDITHVAYTEPQRDLNEISDEISAQKNQLYDAYIKIGKLLLEAKDQLTEHGEWINWLSNSVGISLRTAERCMQLARAYPDSSAMSNLGMTKALALLALPEGKRELFIEQPHEVNGKQKSVEEMSTRELKMAIKVTQDVENQQLSFPVVCSANRRPRALSKVHDEIKSAQGHLAHALELLTQITPPLDEFVDEVCSLQQAMEKVTELVQAAPSPDLGGDPRD